MSELGVTFINQTDESVDKQFLIDRLKLILIRLSHPVRVNIELVIVGDQEIKKLNQRHRDIDQPTDVLSFAGSEELTGSVVISIETATRQAKQAGIDVTEELSVLAGHGLLHLLGYNHR